VILQQLDGRLLVVRQPDHGIQRGEFAAHWARRVSELGPSDSFVGARRTSLAPESDV
jgi:hypothetical protein